MPTMSIADLERLLVRHRMILERVRIYKEGITSDTPAAAQAQRLVEQTERAIRSLEYNQSAFLADSGVQAIDK